MNFLENTFHRLRRDAAQSVLQEVREGRIVSAHGEQLLSAVAKAQAFVIQAGLRRGDRCALLTHNGIR
jgi:hypothetical protein